jgi:hypothetical protein
VDVSCDRRVESVRASGLVVRQESWPRAAGVVDGRGGSAEIACGVACLQRYRIVGVPVAIVVAVELPFLAREEQGRRPCAETSGAVLAWVLAIECELRWWSRRIAFARAPASSALDGIQYGEDHEHCIAEFLRGGVVPTNCVVLIEPRGTDSRQVSCN